jgi:Cd2+/Zn2+-exporting ATPase
VLLLAAYVLAGLPVLKNAARNVLKGHALDENFLMAIATIGAFAIGEWAEAVGVMIFYMIGELIQDAAVSRSRSSIDALLALKPDTARVQSGNGWVEAAAETVAVGAIVLVRPGERIPIDGVVVEGAGLVDASMLSGESRPVGVQAGSEVMSGTVSLDGVLTIKTAKTADNSSAAKIVELVENAREAKAKPERFITAFARYYTPAVVGAAALLAVLPPVLGYGAFSAWLNRALILLVISCPCALVVSVPLGYFAGIGGLSRRGIMVKGASHLDPLARAEYVAFDKTGTLTQGEFAVAKIEAAPGVAERDLLEAAALAEQESNHPIAKAIKKAAKERGVLGPTVSDTGVSASATTAVSPMVSDTAVSSRAGTTAVSPTVPDTPHSRREIAGRGIELDDGRILAGNRRLLEERGVFAADNTASPASPVSGTAGELAYMPNFASPASPVSDTASAYTPVYIAKDGAYLGRILIGDTVKEGAAEAAADLSRLGIKKTLMFTGDTRSSAMAVAAELGIGDVEAELLPQDKLVATEKWTRKGITVFVGDGINDAPVLARADVGIAMGSGSDVAIESADVIIMTSDPRRVVEAIARARAIRRIVTGNIVFALGAKALFIALAVLGLANMWLALIADVGVALAAILNSSRALR